METKIIHSTSINAWNIVNTKLGGKYKIAIIPYLLIDTDDISTEIQKSEALRHAKFISECLNNSKNI